MKRSNIRVIFAALVLILFSIGLLQGCAPLSITSQSETKSLKTPERISSHDPSVVEDNGTYYIFGSHRAWAKSKDLTNWQPFTNNLSTQYSKVFAQIWKDWPYSTANPNVKDNMWAPDVVWNPTMKKWCMYMSLNGANYRSVIVLLTADTIDGDWSYEGPVVYSGFNRANWLHSDVSRVLGKEADISRYQSTTDTGINAIDPAIQIDTDGQMYMSFGSWFGGIWMLKLDNSTGLRDYTAHYKTVSNVSDAYYGYKIAGGFGNSGEGSYILKVKDYWYLFLSYGHLEQRGGYQVREFRSKNLTGPYVDEAGNTAIAEKTESVNWNGDTGIRIMASGIWQGNSPTHIEVSQGHNSAINASDGKTYIIYHTRFSDTQEMHEVRVRQLFQTENGWLTVSPFEHNALHNSQSKKIIESDVPGTYEILKQDPHKSYKGNPNAKSQNAKLRGVSRAMSITLGKNGQISGDEQGSWTLKGNDLTITIDDTTYSCVMSYQNRENDGASIITASGIGNNMSVWLAKKK